jgi:hypothetical protein
MGPSDAIILRNFFPEAYGCSVRKGFREHQTLPTSEPIQTLAFCAAAIDNENVVGSEETLFAGAGGSIWNITDPGQVPVAVVSGIGSGSRFNKWQYVNVSQAAKSFLYMVNGRSNPVVIEYPNIVHRLIEGNGSTAWTIQGVNPNTFVHVTVYQRSLWFTKFDSSSGWYLPPATLWGPIKEFDFGPWFTRGGYLMALANWTVDDTNTAQSRLVAITSAGEAIIFEGTDPTNIEAWACVGTYYIGQPLGRRCFCKFGKDLLVLTQQGIVSMADVSRDSTQELFSAGNGRIIQRLISDAAAIVGQKFGWCVMPFPRGNMIIINVPGMVDTQNTWLVLNTITKAWARFTGMPAFCMTIFYNQPMFALTDTIYEGWIGNMDRVGADGTGGE